jgi:hypothetical protein
MSNTSIQLTIQVASGNINSPNQGHDQRSRSTVVDKITSDHLWTGTRKCGGILYPRNSLKSNEQILFVQCEKGKSRETLSFHGRRRYCYRMNSLPGECQTANPSIWVFGFPLLGSMRPPPQGSLEGSLWKLK